MTPALKRHQAALDQFNRSLLEERMAYTAPHRTYYSTAFRCEKCHRETCVTLHALLVKHGPTVGVSSVDTREVKPYCVYCDEAPT